MCETLKYTKDRAERVGENWNTPTDRAQRSGVKD